MEYLDKHGTELLVTKLKKLVDDTVSSSSQNNTNVDISSPNYGIVTSLDLKSLYLANTPTEKEMNVVVNTNRKDKTFDVFIDGVKKISNWDLSVHYSIQIPNDVNSINITFNDVKCSSYNEYYVNQYNLIEFVYPIINKTNRTFYKLHWEHNTADNLRYSIASAVTLVPSVGGEYSFINQYDAKIYTHLDNTWYSPGSRVRNYKNNTYDSEYKQGFIVLNDLSGTPNIKKAIFDAIFAYSEVYNYTQIKDCCNVIYNLNYIYA